ncbi:MAG: DUF1080 domain-containing protein [Verrucomicrobiota bacterium]
MKLLSPRRLALFTGLALLTSLSAPAADKKGWVTLFDGKNLDHWTLNTEGGWIIEDGVLGAVPGKKNNYVWTKDTFGDFELDLEFKMSEKCNSGVFFRTDPKNPVQGGFEIQVFDSHGKTELSAHDCGALYDAVIPSVNAAKPAGEWNRMQISAKGAMVKVVLNGKTVVEADLDKWTEGNLNPDGTKNKFKTALKDLPRTGYIGFQDHGHPVWFRNVKIKPLSKST